MTAIDLSSEAWRNLVFAHRNRAYGACRLRETAPMRHRTALLGVLLMVGGASLLSLCLKRDTVRQKVVMVEVTTLSQLEPPVVRQPEMKRVEPQAPPPPALKSSIKFTAPVIKQDAEVGEEDEIKSQTELTESKVAISIADVKGNDEEHGQDIADVEQLVVDEPPPPEPEQVFDMAEEMPAFPGGTAELMKYVAKQLRYPVVAQENGVQGRVTCQFVVDSDGQVRDVQVVRSLDPYCDKEAVRVLLSLPRWKPGRQNGKAVSVKYTLPIVFRLQ